MTLSVFKRSILIASAAALLLLASCGGKSEKADSPNSAQSRYFAGGWPYSTPPTGHFNMFAAQGITLKFYHEVHQLPLALYRSADKKFVPVLASSWELNEDGSALEITLRDDARWLSGEAFTSKDVWTTFMIHRLMGDVLWNYIDGVELPDDQTVIFPITEATTMIYRYILRKPIADYKTYGSFADRLSELLDAGKDSESEEWGALLAEFNNYRPDMVNATGPYYLDPEKITQSRVEMPKNENSFLAGTVQFDKLLVYNGGVQDLTPLVLNKEIDFLTHVFPASAVASFEKAGYAMISTPGMDGLALYFNEKVAPLGEQAVRQAFAYIIDRNKVGEIALPGVTRGTKYVSGLGDGMTEEWCDVSRLIDYQVDHEKAAALLESAGLSQSDGQWLLPDGSPFELSLQTPASWTDAAAAATETAQQLSAFGIKTTFKGIESSQRQGNISDGKFELALSFFGTGKSHPMFAYETPLLLSNVNAPGGGLGYNMQRQTETAGFVDVEALIYDSVKGWDSDAQQKTADTLIRVFNESVPVLPLYTKWGKYVSSNGLRTDWQGDDSLYSNSPGDDNFAVYQILMGELTPLNVQ